MATTARLDLSVWRNDDVYEFPLRVRGLDLTDMSLAMQIRIGRDVPGAPLVSLAKVTNGNAEGLRVAGVSIADGIPTSDLRLRLNKTTRQALPYTGEMGDDTPLQYALTIGGRTRLAGSITMLAHAFDSDAAPTNRAAGYRSAGAGAPGSSATLTIAAEDVVSLIIDGADVALEASTRAEAAMTAAEFASAAAIAAGRYFPTRAAGEAGSTNNQLFSTDDGAGNVIYYRRTAGGSVEIGRAVTPAGLAASDGATRIGYGNRTTAAKLAERLSVMDKSADPSGALPSDSAFGAALADSYAGGNRPVHIQTGAYRLEGRVAVTRGTAILGDGSQGSNEAYGTVLKHYSAGDFLEWNGTGGVAAGTGGSLRDALIVKADGYQGGTAIRLVATDSDHRPGEMLLENVLVYGVGSTPGAGGNGGLWGHCLEIDGTAANTPGTRGVRSVHAFKCRFAEATIPNETVLINQATHAFFYGLQIDTGDAAVQQGVTLKGINENINFVASDISGNFLIVANDANNATTDLLLDGKIGGTFTNNDALATGNVTISMSQSAGYVLVNKSPFLSMRTNINPLVKLSRGTTLPNVTGDGTIFTVPFDVEAYDYGNNNAELPANSYTCYCAGKHRISSDILLSGITAAHTRADIAILVNGAARKSLALPLSSVAGGFQSLSIHEILSLPYGAVVQIQVTVSGSTKTVGIYGTSGTNVYSDFTVEYVP